MDMAVPAAARERLLLRFGPAAGEWCDALPPRVAGLARRWSLQPVDQLGGGTSRVFVCRRDDGSRVYLKLTPDPAVAAQEAEALRLWDGCGRTPRLLHADPAEGVLLLAEVTGADGGAAPVLSGRDGSGSGAGEIRLERVAELLAALRGHRPAPDAALPTLAERVDFVFELTRRRIAAAVAHGPDARTAPPDGSAAPGPVAYGTIAPGTVAPSGTVAPGTVAPGSAISAAVDPGLVDRSHAAARALAQSGPVFLVHGDLHAGNVLDAGEARGLVAIDPRPSVGDPDFDAVDWVLEGVRGAEQVEHRIRELADRVPGLDADRLRGWCRATAVLTAGPRAARGARDPHTALLLDLALLAGAST
jgi:streptomycin 6-kinase